MIHSDYHYYRVADRDITTGITARLGFSTFKPVVPSLRYSIATTTTMAMFYLDGSQSLYRALALTLLFNRLVRTGEAAQFLVLIAMVCMIQRPLNGNRQLANEFAT